MSANLGERMKRVFALSLWLSLALPAAAAAAVTVTADNATNIKVEIEATSVAVVLENLRERFGFELDGADKAKDGDALTQTLTGSLKEVLGRLLRNWNYVIVSSEDESDRVARVVILNSSVGAPPVASAKREADAAQMNQISGE